MATGEAQGLPGLVILLFLARPSASCPPYRPQEILDLRSLMFLCRSFRAQQREERAGSRYLTHRICG